VATEPHPNADPSCAKDRVAANGPQGRYAPLTRWPTAILDRRSLLRVGEARSGRKDGAPIEQKDSDFPVALPARRTDFGKSEVCPSVSEVLVLSAVTTQISFSAVSHRPSFFALFELVWRKR
jgi:hypothetical protein